MNDKYNNFQRYLSAKISVDDRALNKDVWRALNLALSPSQHRPLQVLEVGAGIGAMAQRLWRWRLHPHILYTGVDVAPDNIAHARTQLRAWARQMGASLLDASTGFVLYTPERQMGVSLVTADALTFARQSRQTGAWDLLIAHAFLDLVDIPTALPHLMNTLRPGGLGYFTLNFDGVTLFEPMTDVAFETRLMTLYHHSMDARLVNGRPSGDSQAGRHLFGHLRTAGAETLAAGASDWVVFPHDNGYPGDEAYFLHYIIHTVHQELAGHPELDRTRMDAWAERRHDQIDAGVMVYIAHQLDYLARKKK